MTKMGVAVRGFLYVTAQVLTTALSIQSIMDGGGLSTLQLRDWLVIVASAVLNIRAFIDTSNGDSKKTPTDDTKGGTI